MTTDSTEHSLHPGEVGLLTIADRRGDVRNPITFDMRNDVHEVERQSLLEDLTKQGLLTEAARDEAAGERVFQLTDKGRAALTALDQKR